ncbi:geranylgeranyl diphosphate synthase type II [Peptoniphilus olsenii]|uniref:Geranylgeranyl diphosphate synthase type II n=1 Tax=Peptoniphilus olsenii TaxID=411570 RepID=A0ABV2J6R5_9FIRM
MIDIKEIIEKFNIYLNSALDYEENNQHKVLESMKYSLFSGGKRIRPLLCILTYLEFSKNPDLDEILPYAAAIESIHTYSLIHDDLPSMDNDDFRRGKPTNHKVFSEGIAILAGDGLLNMSSELIIKYLDSLDDIKDIKKGIKAMKFLLNSSGVNGMVGGQSIDIDLSINEFNEDICENMYKLKTASLIEAAVAMGGIIAEVDADTLSKLKSFASSVGLAYQLEDDILDENDDPKSNEVNMLLFKEKDEIKNFILKLTDEGFKCIDNLEFNEGILKDFVYKLVNRSY